MWDRILVLYRNYIGTGMIAGLFLVALIYLYATEKNKNNRIVFLYMPSMILVLYFCPFFENIVYKLSGEEIYYRILWLVPVAPVLAYAAVKILINCNEKKRIIAAVSMVIIIILSGKFVYSNIYFSKAENPYHIPQTVIKICDCIKLKNKHFIAAFPDDMVQYVRQYDTSIRLPFGREMIVDRWDYAHSFYEVYESENFDVNLVAAQAKEWSMLYLIISINKPGSDEFVDYGYELIDEIDGYYIYRDRVVYDTWFKD